MVWTLAAQFALFQSVFVVLLSVLTSRKLECFFISDVHGFLGQDWFQECLSQIYCPKVFEMRVFGRLIDHLLNWQMRQSFSQRSTHALWTVTQWYSPIQRAHSNYFTDYHVMENKTTKLVHALLRYQTCNLALYKFFWSILLALSFRWFPLASRKCFENTRGIVYDQFYANFPVLLLDCYLLQGHTY